MRETKFRGLHYNPRTKETKMVYGDLVSNRYIRSGMVGKGKAVIESKEEDKFTCYTVDSKTVGQFIGLKDKNGIKIYEGDIVKCFVEMRDKRGYENTVVQWDQPKVGFSFSALFLFNLRLLDDSKGYDLEVIGNIYENPEKMEETT